MQRAQKVEPAGSWKDAATDTIVLDYDARYRRRFAMKGVGGTEFLLDLPDATVLRHGDALRLEDGRLVEIVAAPEPLIEIRSADPRSLLRIAWHLGNRHTAVAVVSGKLRIRRDRVIEDMVRGIGGKMLEIEGPFDPEGGAYESHADGADSSAHEGHSHAGEAHDHHHHAHEDGAHHDHDHHEHHGHEHEHDHRHN